jgi:peptidoglycan/LPS O-acetylase OafA/YrhL
MRLVALDYIRGIAAMWVFFCHYPFSAQFEQSWPTLHAFFKKGYLGVSMFFVVSGFCIIASANSSARKGESAGSFLYRRLRRIYPPFWVSILVSVSVPFIIAGLSSLKSGHYEPPVPSGHNFGFLRYTPTDWVLTGTLAQTFRPMPGHPGWRFTSLNAVYWSLALEVQFYIVVALALYLSPSRMRWILLGVTLLSIPAAALNDASGYTSGFFLWWWPLFALGGALFYLMKHGIHPTRPVSMLLVVIGAAAIAYTFQFRGGLYEQILFALGFSAILWCALPFDGKLAAMQEHRLWRYPLGAMALLGAMSYSIYLIHGRIQHVAAQVTRQVFGPTTLGDATAMALTLIACWPFYLWCEKPFIGSAPAARRVVPEMQPAEGVLNQEGAV